MAVGVRRNRLRPPAPHPLERAAEHTQAPVCAEAQRRMAFDTGELELRPGLLPSVSLALQLATSVTLGCNLGKEGHLAPRLLQGLRIAYTK